MKTCSKCHESKPETDFPKQGCNKDGLNYTCKSCNNNYMKHYLSQTASGKYRRLKEHAIQDGIKFLLDRKDFIAWFEKQDKVCYYCHIALVSNIGRHLMNDGLTIDKLNPQIGYKLDNIVLSCRQCNLVKGDWFTPEQMTEIANKYFSHH